MPPCADAPLEAHIATTAPLSLTQLAVAALAERLLSLSGDVDAAIACSGLMHLQVPCRVAGAVSHVSLIITKSSTRCSHP